MRLLERMPNGAFRLQSFSDQNLPTYAILSHTWHEDNTQEIDFQDVGNGVGSDKTGWAKLQFCADRSAKDGLRWFWIDTCCIDKRNAVELSTAINSMFRWYQQSARCYVYLPDVSLSDANQQSPEGRLESGWESAFRRSRWFTRGWTLQELVAPSLVEFYDSSGERLGNKESLSTIIRDITGICDLALQGSPLSNFTIKERKSWAERRVTTIEEDLVYSLLGIFDVTMPLIYGEGKDRAFRRLDDEIHKLHKGG